MKKKQIWISFSIFIILCLVIEIVGSFWTRETVSTWYPTLEKPLWTPPDWVFGPVWFCLYIMIAVAGWLIYRAKYSYQRTNALIFYGTQLALNFIWSFLFFSLRSPLLGLIDIILLWIFINLTIIKAWSVSRLAAFLLIPYLVWVTYAVSLNIGICILNRSMF
jgi:benzodiazapine receptor